MDSEKFAVIGAGFCGLGVMGAFQRHDIPFEAFEAFEALFDRLAISLLALAMESANCWLARYLTNPRAMLSGLARLVNWFGRQAPGISWARRSATPL